MAVASAALTCALVVATCVQGPTSDAHAQAPTTRLTVGGGRARSGVHPLRAAFTPDPFSTATRPGGAIHVADLRLGAGCRGYVAAEPDAIVRFSGSAPLLRFFVRAATDVTLVIADPSGRFLCNDDAIPGRTTNAMVDVFAPRPGQYDVWIGAHAPSTQVDATLFVTGSRDQRP
ncbi:Hypothetical protein I5071_85000 [Sandaracinus amylolyticus]|nr:Hypothetical protein I5071_85000 [Sandaracinus amylolyticus]